MTVRVIDGRAKFGCDIDTFYRKPEMAAMLARRGVLAPPPAADVDEDGPYAFARINVLYGVARWIATCPLCRVGSEYVWLDAPRFLCCACGNRAVGGRWLRVAVPSDFRSIERMLLARPDPETRNWNPEDAPESLAVEQVMLHGGGG